MVPIEAPMKIAIQDSSHTGVPAIERLIEFHSPQPWNVVAQAEKAKNHINCKPYSIELRVFQGYYLHQPQHKYHEIKRCTGEDHDPCPEVIANCSNILQHIIHHEYNVQKLQGPASNAGKH